MSKLEFFIQVFKLYIGNYITVIVWAGLHRRSTLDHQIPCVDLDHLIIASNCACSCIDPESRFRVRMTESHFARFPWRSDLVRWRAVLWRHPSTDWGTGWCARLRRSWRTGRTCRKRRTTIRSCTRTPSSRPHSPVSSTGTPRRWRQICRRFDPAPNLKLEIVMRRLALILLS